MNRKRALVVLAVAMTSILAAPAAAFAAPGYQHVVLAHKPIAFWRLAERTGTIAYDLTTNGNNAAYEANPTLGLPGSITHDPATAVGFDSPNQDVVWAPTSSVTGPFTVTAWIDNTGSTGYSEQTFFDTRTPFAECSFDFKLSHGNLKVDVGNGSTFFLTGPGIPYSFNVNEWYQVAAAVTGTQVTLYVDGRTIGSESYPYGTGVPLLFDPSHLVYLATNARFRSTEEFLGDLDDVAIYRGLLTPDEINGLYHSGIAG